LKKKIFIWACDIRNNSGEGILANYFVKFIYKNKKNKIKIKTSEHKDNFYHKYITPLLGIFYCWLFFIKKYRVCYINYLPFWNIFLFILLPPRTILGPITGGANINNNNKLNIFLRLYIFHALYKVSEIFINLRNKKILFSTELLKKYLSTHTINKSIFNFNFICIKFHKMKKKNIDLVIYYRKHHNKSEEEIFKILNAIKYKNYKIIIIGDYLNLAYVKNIGFISFKRVNNILSKAKFSIISSENRHSLFTLNCLSQNVQILTTNKIIKEKLFSSNDFLTFDKELPKWNRNGLKENIYKNHLKIINKFKLYFKTI
jgi:hypothetical protein